ncbi:hypothetical protein GYMLUDRAFT_50553 [Collybiopsis luxurians FD-317 M1]|uniref:Uncharacterized protein n=1 Tax=Collybiopsis luxurians FD-317 M1 TaxID=944289 RepID=A0A0D0C122_9AGAR|nr:hypothetical protein GYMLUDRAFT_50553 [Collybiopsis luxurians FD-317 M1]
MSLEESSPEPRFPQETFYLFIDESSDSTAQLKVLSLVCKSWHIRAREHLFRLFPIYQKLILDEDYQERSLRLQLLTQSFDWLLHDRGITDLIRGIYVLPRGLEPGKKPGPLHHHARRDFIVDHPWLQQNTFPPNKYHFLVLEGIDLRRRTLPVILQSSINGGFKRAFFKHPVIYFGNRGNSSSSEGPLEHLAAHAPLLETLCISNFRAEEGGGGVIQDRDTASLNNLRQALRTLRIKDQVHGKSVTLKQFMLHDEGIPRNRVLEILIFETPYLNFANLEYLAIDSTSIALLVGRSHVLRNVKHLSLFDKEPDYLPDVWAYRKAQISLPSLTTLQLILRRFQALLTLCRVILGPSDVVCGSGNGMEYPGLPFYTSFTQQAPPPPSSFAYPQVKHLHVCFDFSKEARKGAVPALSVSRIGATSSSGPTVTLDANLASRIDETLYSYLDEGGGPLTSITLESSHDLPLRSFVQTNNSGKLRSDKGYDWWETRFW